MHFEFVHDFDIPLDALELAVISKNLFPELAKRLHGIEGISQNERLVGTREHARLERCWSYRATMKMPAFARSYVTPEMCAWDEESTYDLSTHASEWTIRPRVKPEWQKFFAASGTYALSALGDGRTRRTATGAIQLRVPLMRPLRQMGEKLIANEVKKMFEAEAATLGELATLA